MAAGNLVEMRRFRFMRFRGIVIRYRRREQRRILLTFELTVELRNLQKQQTQTALCIPESSVTTKALTNSNAH
jgi:hypothetical protein